MSKRDIDVEIDSKENIAGLLEGVPLRWPRPEAQEDFA